ncbi:rhamnan synthesis F family protein [Bifidobacterium breve]|uniref:Alpha-L-Rha alpha-1 2-L-rhamnosyltransferase/alpha-L-Rha alpha-1 3-L-rhamnosyltransferase n=1 Tax=Bifidobacterium breve TaxID=1685 RepID=A0AAN1IJG2_BIFBR|nr:rhamnan synthesis F family protein [Bifidobacterium breve]AUD92110.1 Alpha-L-Rha alpha-1 2-L-rhamnosyltransferase/alpha-L-Rha alpha-1 3-L-rhamnosyltransferase [Bifidobacterium breve]AUE19543.1 Alpha-L-Rha alpha-1 2-L-rhamnosyltransferase/alpha-L-Rha alpha-1 3-L-rhamnosyltransferase [Bifidobacterium breve]
MSVNSGHKQRLGIYCFYDKYGHAASFIKTFLDDLMDNLDDLVVVVNGQLSDQARQLFSEYTKTIIVRENKGLDVAAYKQAILTLGWEKLESYDEVICLNDTVMGPVYPFREMFACMDRKDVDFWGITAYAGETVDKEQIPTHLQAYWHAYRRSLVSSPAFHEYWETMPLWKDYAEVTRKHEMTFTKHFADLGFTWASYIDWRKYQGYSSYPLLYMPMQIVRDDRCPIFKRRSFFVDYSAYFDQTAGQPALDLYEYLRDHADYDVDMIWDAILPSYNIDDIRKAMHLDYVLPSQAINPQTHDHPRSAFIYHVYFMDLLEDTCHYIASLPEETDLYITSTEDKIPQIREYMQQHGISHQATFIPVINRGRDVSALLVAACPVVLSGKYDVIGFAHDKKSSQNQENGHHGTESQGFAYKLMENTLGSEAYVKNILTLFAENPRLGQVAPPPPYHALYFAHTIPHDWGANYEITKELLEDRLGIHVPLSPTKPTASAMGSCYWFRVEALKPLFEYGWKYEDFLPEGQMGEDGTISHAIERANGYICQSRGYYPAWVLSDRYARIEVDSLFYTAAMMMGSSAEARRGESLLTNLRGLNLATSRWRTLKIAKHRIHLGLQWITSRTVLKLPKPAQSVIYTAAWAPITAVRFVIGQIRAVLRGDFKHKSAPKKIVDGK